MVQILNNNDLDELEDKQNKEKAATQENDVTLTALAAHIQNKYSIARTANWDLMNEIEENYRQRQGKYETSKLDEIKKIGGSQIFRRLTAVKCNAAEAWIADTLAPAGDRPWELAPTKNPEISPEDQQNIIQETVLHFQEMQQDGVEVDPEEVIKFANSQYNEVMEKVRKDADEKAERMSDLIEDQLTEAKFLPALKETISDVVTAKFGVLKGPIVRHHMALEWSKDESGQTIAIRKQKEAYEFERVAPLDLYLAPDMRTLDEGYICEKQRYTRGELYNMIGIEGYDETAIRAVLAMAETQDIIDDEDIRRSERFELENRDNTYVHAGESGIIEGVEYHGAVQGRMLKDWGLKVDDDDADYEIWAILIAGHIIKAELNPDVLGRRPYFITSFEKTPGSLIGFGVPDKMRDSQAMCNATMRALSNNLAISSGPQTAIDPDAMPSAENITSMRPHKIWQMKSVNGKLPIQFFQPNSNANELIGVYDKFKDESDEDTGIPRYVYGDQDVKGAGETASGLSMLMNAASKGIRAVIRNIDDDIVKQVITRMFQANMLDSEVPEELKGDLVVMARGALALLVKDQLQQARREYLQQTMNPYDAQILGLEGRLQIHREIIKNLEMPESLLPTVEEFKQRVEMEQQQAMQAQEQEQLNQGAMI